MAKIKELKLGGIEKPEYTTYLANDKAKMKYISRIEKLVRSSTEYRDYVGFLKDYVDMTSCAFFNKVSSESNRRISIEIHHEPFTLMDITMTVVNKWLSEAVPLNDLLIADEIMDIHYSNMVGLIPLSKTVHEVVHSDSHVVIPLYLIYGKYGDFLKAYQEYLPDELYDKIERKIALTRAINSSSFDIFNREFEYINVDGFQLLTKLDLTEDKNKDQ